MNQPKGDSKDQKNVELGADFETATSATGFGLFNVLLLVIALPSCLASIFETSTMSFILPAAECDLKLSLVDKGRLNAMTYAGMIVGGFFWGYLADTTGRKKLLGSGYLLDGLCVLCSSLSQNVHTLMFFKFLGGFIVCGPFAVLLSYVTEFHGTKHRSIVMMILGMFFSTASILLPVLAWGILPQPWDFEFFDNLLAIHSWQIFLAVSAIPSLLAGFFIHFFPESPKFLMTQGKNEEALKVFQTVFRVNTGRSRNEFPIKSLINETNQQEQQVFSIDTIKKSQLANKVDRKNKKFSAMHILKQMKPMCKQPILKHSVLVYTIQFCILLGLNTLRLWLPQLFTSIEQYENEHNSTSANLCTMIEFSVVKIQNNIENQNFNECEIKNLDRMYVNGIIVGLSSLSSYLIAGTLINWLGNKRILIMALMTSGFTGIGLYWSISSLSTLILSTIFVSISSISSTTLLGVIVNLFPTSLRTMILSLAMMFGRSGALSGNLMFPYFMSFGCFPPFLMIGSVMLVASFLCFFLPVTHKLPLK